MCWPNIEVFPSPFPNFLPPSHWLGKLFTSPQFSTVFLIQDETWVLDQSEHAQGPIYILNLNKVFIIIIIIITIIIIYSELSKKFKKYFASPIQQMVLHWRLHVASNGLTVLHSHMCNEYLSTTKMCNQLKYGKTMQ